MTYDPRTERIGYDGRRGGSGVRGFVGKSLAFAAGAVLLVGAVAISVMAFAVIATGMLVFGAYLWWKTRDLRKQMRASHAHSNVIEGEIITKVVREVEPHDRDAR